MNQSRSRSHVVESVRHLLEALSVDTDDPNWEETPRRFADYLLEHWPSPDEVSRVLEDARRATFPSDYRGIVAQSGIRVFGICPHHLLPIEYTIDLGYISSGKAIGLSKLARLAELIARQPLIQEDVTHRLAQTLCEVLETPHVIVVVRGIHSCMRIRGVEQLDTITSTSVVGGFFDEDDRGAKQEFLRLISRE